MELTITAKIKLYPTKEQIEIRKIISLNARTVIILPMMTE